MSEWRTGDQGQRYPVQSPIEAVPVGRRLLKVWYVETRLQDGRKFNLRVNAFNRDEAIAIVQNQFPKATVVKVIPEWRYRLARRGASALGSLTVRGIRGVLE